MAGNQHRRRRLTEPGAAGHGVCAASWLGWADRRGRGGRGTPGRPEQRALASTSAVAVVKLARAQALPPTRACPRTSRGDRDQAPSDDETREVAHPCGSSTTTASSGSASRCGRSGGRRTPGPRPGRTEGGR
ncbi:hypothetical protein QJS66_02655 [Kocuria rhizophila]|nr:hypothetical protein QJS66_02655 [Kocuria rhizophila]